MISFAKWIYRKIKRLISPLLVNNISGLWQNQPYRALLYYKTGLFLRFKKSQYAHTNEWEIIEIIHILNSLGFSVDVVDRSLTNFTPQNKYDLFIGLAAGSSGKFFKKYAEALSSALKIALCAGPEPALSRKLVQEQYDRFNKRHHSNIPAMRMPNVDFDAFVKHADAIFAIGEEGSFCPRSYEIHNKPIYTYLPGCSSKVQFLHKWLGTRKRNKFLCFAGNGFICKGVDLIVETFSKHPNLTVHICGPADEKGFFEYLGATINHSNNIIFEGFVPVGSIKFEELISTCSFVVFNSSSEGCATSVATVMQAGLVPILNYETGINIGNFGIPIINTEDRIFSTEKAIAEAASMSDEEYKLRVIHTVMDAQKYSQASFTLNFKNSLIKFLLDHRLCNS